MTRSPVHRLARAAGRPGRPPVRAVLAAVGVAAVLMAAPASAQTAAPM